MLLRELPHGDGIVIDILVGTFIGDTAAYLGGRAFGTRPLAPRDLAQQDARGARLRDRRRHARGLVRRPLPGLARRLERAAARRRRSGSSAPLGDLFESKVKRDAGDKDAGTLFGPTAARSTGSTPRSSRSSPGTTCGWRCCDELDQTRHVEAGPDDRGTEERRRDRQMIELLNELRVALPGVQILFAFLLTVPFSQRFAQAHGVPARRLLRDADGHGALDGLPDRAVRRAPAALPPGRARVDRRVGEPADDRRPRASSRSRSAARCC